MKGASVVHEGDVAPRSEPGEKARQEAEAGVDEVELDALHLRLAGVLGLGDRKGIDARGAGDRDALLGSREGDDLVGDVLAEECNGPEDGRRGIGLDGHVVVGRFARSQVWVGDGLRSKAARGVGGDAGGAVLSQLRIFWTRQGSGDRASHD